MQLFSQHTLFQENYTQLSHTPCTPQGNLLLHAEWQSSCLSINTHALCKFKHGRQSCTIWQQKVLTTFFSWSLKYLQLFFFQEHKSEQRLALYLITSAWLVLQKYPTNGTNLCRSDKTTTHQTRPTLRDAQKDVTLTHSKVYQFSMQTQDI